jgi:dipeptidyl aminopeptidase/acylaminoacyl peptidase
MSEPLVAPYGSWKSPISAEVVIAETVRLSSIALDGEDVYWLEMRPEEGGRYTVVRRSPNGQTTDVTPAAFNVRTRVHEYGGGSYTVAAGTVYFSNWDDQRLYCQELGREPRAITPKAKLRYADGAIDGRRGRMLCVCEDHSAPGQEAANSLVALDLEGKRQRRVLAAGNDFYASPRLSPDGSLLAWLTWNHPNMPWDGTELWLGSLADDGTLLDSRRVAGGEAESIFQPEWSPDGTLYFASDRTGWWNLCRWSDGHVELLCAMEAEFGLPQWVFGMSTYAFVSNTSIICAYTKQGSWHLARLDTVTGHLTSIDTPYTMITQVRATPRRALFLGGSPTEAVAVVELDLATGEHQVLRRTTQADVDPAYISLPEPVEFPTEKGLTAHAFFYAPRNRDAVGPQHERPPLLVISHGGPTAAADTTLSLGYQYWTSRGFAVLDVNYGGSTGYGRAYRQRLNGQWGIVDVDDCANAARYLVERGEVDGERLIIRGGSAGGYTTLCALTFRELFAAGASYYGVSDLEALTKETHKFESRYLDQMVGPYPESRELYVERSPIHFSERLGCPVIFFQGLEDQVVPPNQAERLVEALQTKGVPVAYVPFEGEQHGFRRAENLKRALEAELSFYSQIFCFELADRVEPLAIDNL